MSSYKRPASAGPIPGCRRGASPPRLSKGAAVSSITIDLERNPHLEFRIDSFQVPEAVRQEFEAAMRRNLAFLDTLPGLLGHLVFEKTGGPTAFSLTTIAVWQDHQAIEAAGERVR